MASEDDRCFSVVQSELRSKSYQKPVEWLEEDYTQKIPLQFGKPGVFLQERVD